MLVGVFLHQKTYKPQALAENDTYVLISAC